jgi:polygalacturonase
MKITLPTVIAVLLLACYSNCPAQDIPLPAIPNTTFTITDYGAAGDGKTTNTAAIQHAADAASKAGGGTVLVPAGKFPTGPFTLASGINLHLARDAFILISNNLTNYPISNGRYVDAITAKNAHDLEISGEGTIDGQGQAWWAEFRAHPGMTHRPYLIKFSGCQRVEVTGVTLQNSPMFHLVPQDCTDVTIRGVTIRSPADSPNTDGIDPSGWNFLITQCAIDTGDDNIAIKPTRDRSPGNKNYLVTDCQFLHGHGMSIGSGTFGGVEDLTFRNCDLNGTDSGIRIKSGRDRGGLLRHVIYENLTMANVKHPVYIIDYYPESTAPGDPATETNAPVTGTTPVTRDITIRNITATNCPTAGAIRGLPEMPIANITFMNVNISAKTGMNIYRARAIHFTNSSIKVETGKPLDLFDAKVSGLP